MWRYWWQRGHYAEGRAWFESALSVGADQPEALRARARQGLASMLMGTGEYAAAIALLETCLSLYEREGDYERTVATLTDLGIANTDLGDLARAGEFFERGLNLTRAASDVRRSAVCLINLGDLAMLDNDLDRASALLDEAYGLMLQVGDTQSAGNVLGNRGQLELARGDLEAAATTLIEGIRLSRQSDDRYSLLHQLIAVAGLLNQRGSADIAATVLGRVEALQEEMSIAINPTELRLMTATLSDLRERLDPAQLEASLGAGRALDHDAGLEVALASLSADSSGGGS
jgi:tetratricopeptide (TPR) repeat protein